MIHFAACRTRDRSPGNKRIIIFDLNGINICDPNGIKICNLNKIYMIRMKDYL